MQASKNYRPDNQEEKLKPPPLIPLSSLDNEEEKFDKGDTPSDNFFDSFRDGGSEDCDSSPSFGPDMREMRQGLRDLDEGNKYNLTEVVDEMLANSKGADTPKLGLKVMSFGEGMNFALDVKLGSRQILTEVIEEPVGNEETNEAVNGENHQSTPKASDCLEELSPKTPVQIVGQRITIDEEHKSTEEQKA